MDKIMRALLILTALFATSTTAYAIDAYKCAVSQTGDLQDSGEISESNFTRLSNGNEFVVDKGTGRIKGGLSNDNAFGQPQVLDYGSSEQAFKVLTVFKPNITINYLYIQEFNESEEKPFMFVSGSEIYSGKCVAY